MNARRFVLDLLSAAPSFELRLSQILKGAAVLDVKETAVRVALTRLVSEGRLHRPSRGVYAMTAVDDGVARLVRGWRNREDDVGPWDGGFLGVAGLVTDRQRTRGAQLCGLRKPWPSLDLWVRPDNLRGGIEAFRRRVHGVIDAPRAVVFTLGGMSDHDRQSIRSGYDIDALHAEYAARTSALVAARAALSGMTNARAARRSFEVGGAAISWLLRDPMLPGAWVEVRARQGLLAELRRFDAAGRRRWDSLLGLRGAGTDAAPVAVQVHVERVRA